MKKINDLEPFEIEEKCFREWVEKDLKTLYFMDKNGGDYFNKAGTYYYQCGPHAEMVGTITIQN